jgi:hypothetical protein
MRRRQSNSELRRSYSGAKQRSSESSHGNTIARWNCPHCRMGSPRHWNVERHIWRLHQGLGEPVNEFGKTRQQCLTDINQQFRHKNQNGQRFAAFYHDKFRELRFSSTHNHGIDNNKRWWSFMDDFIEPAKRTLEFNKVLAELLNQQAPYHSPSTFFHQYQPIHQYPSSISNPINSNSTEAELILRQLHARAANWYQSKNWSSPSGYWWVQ